jgi:small nuclear ribonucleoprotein (snRNP)-like protein
MKQTNIHESEKLNNLLYKRVKLVLNDNTVHVGVLTLDDYSNRYKLDREIMNKGPLCFYRSHVKKIEELEG